MINLIIKVAKSVEGIGPFQSLSLLANPEDTIARVKARYIMKYNVTYNGYIYFQYKGIELLDDHTLADYDIIDGMSILHQLYRMPSYGAIDYTSLAGKFEIERQWSKGDEWKKYPAVFKRSTKNIWASVPESNDTTLISKPPAINGGRGYRASPHHRSSKDSETKTRSFKHVYVANVNGFTFQVLHRMEGRWNGEMSIIDAGFYSTPPEVNVWTLSLEFDAKLNCWHERQSITNSRGLTTATKFLLKPVANGLLHVDGEDRHLRDCEVRLEERGNSVMLLTAVNPISGRLLVVETITMIDEMRRTRTRQHFDDKTGEFKTLYIMKEHRVIDEMTGALMKS